MKYIRTKNGRIYEVIEETENGFELCGPFEKKMGCGCIMIKRMLGSNEKPTYRLADTIQELCDEFVYIDSIGSFLISIDWYTEERKVEKAIVEFECMTLSKPLKICLREGIVYGAIWTEKGLIYVAKMNDKGEFELL